MRAEGPNPGPRHKVNGVNAPDQTNNLIEYKDQTSMIQTSMLFYNIDIVHSLRVRVAALTHTHCKCIYLT